MRDHRADVEHEEPGDEGLGQAERSEIRLDEPRSTISSTTKPTIQKTVWRSSSSSREPSGQSAAHMMTALDCRKPPRLIISRNGRIRISRSWVKR